MQRDCNEDTSSAEDTGGAQGLTTTRKRAVAGTWEQGTGKKRNVSITKQKHRQRKSKRSITDMLEGSSEDDTEDDEETWSATESSTRDVGRSTQSPQGSRGNGKKKKRKKKN